MKKILVFSLILIVAILSIGCSGDDGLIGDEVTINSVDLPEEKVLEVGEDYTLPKTAEATMSDGSTEAVKINWAEEVDTSEPVEKVEYRGLVEGYDDYRVTIQITVEEESKEPIIESLEIEPQEAVVEVGEDYSLPQTATAVMSDGSEEEVDVMWDKEIDTTEPVEGEKYTGSVEGTDLTVTFTLTVIEDQEEPIIESLEIEPSEAEVKVGEGYSLPQTATAVMSDGSEEEVDVMWDKEVDTTEPVEGEKYTGSVEGTDLTVTFTLTVIEESAGGIGIDVDWETAPAAPKNVSADTSDNAVILGWDHVDQDLAAVDDSTKEFGGYYIYRSTEEGELGTAVQSNLIKDNSYLDEDVEAGETYYYQIRAYGGEDGDLAGDFSEVITITID